MSRFEGILRALDEVGMRHWTLDQLPLKRGSLQILGTDTPRVSELEAQRLLDVLRRDPSFPGSLRGAYLPKQPSLRDRYSPAIIWDGRDAAHSDLAEMYDFENAGEALNADEASRLIRTLREMLKAGGYAGGAGALAYATGDGVGL